MILGLFKVSGHSMIPYLKPGDRVISSSIPYFFTEPKVGDIVLFKNNGKPRTRTQVVRGKILIKRIALIENKKYYLKGDNKSDSLKVEPINKSSILGKVISIVKNNL